MLIVIWTCGCLLIPATLPFRIAKRKVYLQGYAGQIRGAQYIRAIHRIRTGRAKVVRFNGHQKIH